MRQFTFNTDAESPKKSLIRDYLNPSPAPMPEFTLGEGVPVNLFLASPSNPSATGYDALSGNDTLEIAVGVGTPGNAPVTLQNTWEVIEDSQNRPIGWTGVLPFNSDPLAALFTPGQPYIFATLEFQYTNANNNTVKFGSPPIVVHAEVVNTDESFFANSVSGTFSIPNGVDQGTVTGLGLSAAPKSVRFSPIIKPAGGLNLFPSLVSNSLTSDGFTFTLNGATDATGYSLYYTIIF